MSQTIATQLSSTPSGGYHDETGAVAERRGILGAARAARAAPSCSASEATRRHLGQFAIDRKRTTVNSWEPLCDNRTEDKQDTLRGAATTRRAAHSPEEKREKKKKRRLGRRGSRAGRPTGARMPLITGKEGW